MIILSYCSGTPCSTVENLFPIFILINYLITSALLEFNIFYLQSDADTVVEECEESLKVLELSDTGNKSLHTTLPNILPSSLIGLHLNYYPKMLLIFFSGCFKCFSICK